MESPKKTKPQNRKFTVSKTQKFPVLNSKSKTHKHPGITDIILSEDLVTSP
jgi:hypothetical protein